MLIPCPKCGAMNSLENQKQCHMCRAVLRRCSDCLHLNRTYMECTVLDFVMTKRQAEGPTMLSTSASCPRYTYHRQAA